MQSSRNTARELLLVVLTGTCLSAGILRGADNSTSSTTAKAVPPPPPASAHSVAIHPAVKKTGPVATSPHSRVSGQGRANFATAHSTTHGTPTLAARTARHGTTSHNPQRRSTTASNSRTHTLTGQQRLARLHLQPARVAEIQQALIREGYLQGDANGMWDGRTHDAMMRYQTMYGFPATGLPEAKSLMKLGLGAHPLPPSSTVARLAFPARPLPRATSA